MYAKIDRQLKAIKRNELTTDSTTIRRYIETETGKKVVYKGPSGSPYYYQLRKLLSSQKFIPSDIVCENEKFII